jgi:hypothetical protein
VPVRRSKRVVAVPPLLSVQLADSVAAAAEDGANASNIAETTPDILFPITLPSLSSAERAWPILNSYLS